MLIRGAMVGAACLSQLRPTKALLHKQTRRTGRTTRTTIPWDCRIATLQRLKRYSLKKSTNKNTKGSKCTFRNTKSKRPPRRQSKSRPIVMQSDKDKKHTQPYQGAITMNNNIWITDCDLCLPRHPPKGRMRAKQTAQRRYFEKTRGGSNY
jgi:hypothetical protein